MWEKIESIRIDRKTIIYIVVVLIALAGVTPALADYLGPNRTVTETTGVCKVILYECQYVSSKQDWRYRISDTWSCSNESKPWQAYPDQPSSQGCFSATNGDQFWAQEDTLQTVTTTYPPATISSMLQNCTESNGWCLTSPQVSLSAVEPVSGYSIAAIEGSLNGQTFACLGSPCDVPLSEGDNTLSFWALSTWGDSSTMGTLTAKVDSQLPAINGSLSGITGSNGWYLSPVSFNGSASDSTSGLESFVCTLDGVALASCSSINISGEGAHTLVLTAHDNAGNLRTWTQNVSLDTLSPSLNAGINGTLGSNNWFNAATLNASAVDPNPGSGLSSFEYSLDKTSWQTFPASGIQPLPEGKHSVDIRATDSAGHLVSASKTFWLDTVRPTVNVNATGTIGANNWYITSPSIAASAQDDTSGISVFEYSLDNNTWTAYTTPLTLSNGAHSISFWAQDQSGLSKQVDHTYQVDTRSPQIAGSVSGVPGLNGWYVSKVTLSASASDPTPGSGLETFSYILNNDAPFPYTTSLNLVDGQHTIQLIAQDQAGLNYSVEQNIKVDTTQPSLSVSSTLPSWVKNDVVLSGSATDNGSGTSKVEISINGGQTWQAASGTTSWSYGWDTQSGPDDSYNVHIRVTDNAGLKTEQIINVGVDNHAPKISLPDSWYQWDSVTLDVWDNVSGVSEARIEISDTEGRWPKRVIRLNPDEFPLEFKWDRRFGDNTIAPLGTYNVKVTAFDNLGNISDQSASIKILLDIIPAGPASTPQPYSRAEDTPETVNTVAPIIVPTETPAPVVSAFGEIETTANADDDSLSTTPATPHATPAQTNVWEWIESIFVPAENSTEKVTEIKSSDTQPSAAGAMSSPSNILWGATAAAVIGATTAYIVEENRRQKEEKEWQQYLEAQQKAEEKEGGHARRKALKLEKLEHQWAQEEALEEARLLREQLLQAEHGDRMDAKMAYLEAEDDAKWNVSQAVIQQRAKEKELQEGLAAYYAAMRQGEKEAAPEPNWWEKTKAFTKEQILQPLTTYVYAPFIEPVAEVTGQVIADAVAWTNKTIYEPYIRPELESAQKVVVSAITWTNENLVQPYIKPAVGASIDALSSGISWINENVYQPYIQPTIATLNEKIYEPYVEPFANPVMDAIVAGVSWVNNNVYEPSIQRVADVMEVMNEYIYEPIFKPVVDDISKLWNNYGESVHSALDTVGFIPGLGDIADALNGLAYLGEGRYLEAGISAMAMVPILGDLGKAGKWGLQLGEEIVEEVVEEVAEKVVKETVEELVEQTAQEALEEVSEKIIQESAEELLEKATKETLEEIAEKTLKEVGQEVVEVVSKILPENITKEVVEEMTEKAVKETGVVLSAVVAKETPEVAEKIFEEAVQQASKVTTEFVQELSEKYGKEAVDRFLPFCERYGIDPYDVLTRPPAEGQTLMGWALGITDIKNPINHPLKSLDLTDEQIKKILADSIQRPDKNIVVLGYGKGAAKPYYELSDQIEGCHLSLSSDAWAPFNEARANFWADVNGPFLEKSVQDRKAFIFNIKYETITDPDNIERFSLPELRLIEEIGKNYVNVPLGEYTAFIPVESMDTYWPLLTDLLK